MGLGGKSALSRKMTPSGHASCICLNVSSSFSFMYLFINVFVNVYSNLGRRSQVMKNDC